MFKILVVEDDKNLRKIKECCDVRRSCCRTRTV